jgi:transcriptional regulator with XRE-family HTH domain
MTASFGERLKELRETAGVSQDGLARLACLSTSTVAKIERLNIDPSWTTVQALAKALGVTTEAFACAAPAPAKKGNRKAKS